MKNLSILLILVVVFFSCQKKEIQKDIPFYDENLGFEERANDIISRLTLEEKIGQLNFVAAPVERFGILPYNWWNECLHGVGRAGLATVFPQAIGLGATWNKELMFRISTVISDEARAKHHEFQKNHKYGIYYGLTFWSPNINIFRDPRWGRGQETYGEDPFLTGQMAVSFIRGLQGNDLKYLKLVATSKHFAVHSGPEESRHRINIGVDEIDLRETYLPAFKTTIKDAKVESVMCAYNRLRDEACCGSNLLLKSILRDEWKFNGYVVSDCWAISDFFRQDGHHVSQDAPGAAALAYKTGTDLNCGNTSPYLKEAVDKNLISEEEINTSLKRLFMARLRLGMFDSPENVPWSRIPYSNVRQEENLEVARQTSRESVVLLKNDGLLPLKKTVKKVAVIGPVAHDYKILLGNYHGTSDHLITPLEGIRNHLASSGTEVNYVPGCPIAEGVPLLETIPAGFLKPLHGQGNGLNVSYFGNRDLKGDPALQQVDSTVDFFFYDKTPVSGKMADEFSARWEGYLVPEVSGIYALGLNACNAARLWVEDSLYIDFDNGHEPGERYFNINLEAGQPYKIIAELINYGNDPQIHLLWSVPGRDYEKEALELAGQSEVIVLVMGLTPRLEGEEMPVQLKGFAGGDRSDILLPEAQETLMKKIATLKKPVVLVLVGGSAIAVNWADQNLPAILEAWYPGEYGGQAIAEVLFGDYNPSGRLPVTFYKSVEDLPEFENYHMEGRTYKYFKGTPLYPFGHGLSYTQFTYSDLKISEPEFSGITELTVAVKVTNAGKRDGDEVVQLYFRDLESGFSIPQLELAGFEKVFLARGETKEIIFKLIPEQLAVVSDTGDRILENGEFMIFVGGKQPGMKGNADAPTTEVISTIIKFNGEDKNLGK